MNPENDGIDHINVYSKGKTTLGRLLSNFANTPFEIPGQGKFRTVEGYWFWIITGVESLRILEGWAAKETAKMLPKKRTHPTESELLEAYRAKLKAHPRIRTMLKENKLPLAHYYVYNGRVVEPKEWQWTAQLWNKLAEE